MWDSEKRAVIEAAKEIATKGLVSGTAGNVSLRLRVSGGRELVAITPSGRRYDSLEVDDIVVIDFDGKPVEGHWAASIERMLHIEVYKARKKVGAVIHTHPVFCSIIAVASLEIPAIIDEQVTYIGGEIKVARYAPPGSAELATNAVSALGPRNAAILANHGALCVGRDMREALDICELLERTAKIYVCALRLGKVSPLPAEAVEREKAIFSAIYGESGP